MAGKIRVALMMGGKSTEREVSLASGREVLTYIDRNRFEVRIYDPATDLARLAAEVDQLDVAFLALHGPFGEDGAMQGFCEMIGLPYTGSGVSASALAINKITTKKIYRDAKLPVAGDLVLERGREPEPEMVERALQTLGLPLVVKPVGQGSSVGLSLVKGESQLRQALSLAFQYDRYILLEEYLEGRELTCAVLGNERLTALPPIEIIPASGHSFFDYEAKYTPGQAEEVCPALLSEAQTTEISALTKAAHQALGCRGFSRTDFMLCQNRFFLLETNTLPGMTSGSLLPKAAKAYRLPFGNFITYLIDLALNRDEDEEIRPEDYR